MGKQGGQKLGVDPLGEEPLPTTNVNPLAVLKAHDKPQKAAPKSRRQLLVPAIQEALQTLTNKDFGRVGEWEVWWRHNRSRFQVAQ